MYKLTDKGTRVQQMFNQIAPRYDLLNRLLSLGIDRRWRRIAVSRLTIPENGQVLDVATGTGDVALEIARQTANSVSVFGIDFSGEMVELGRHKIALSSFARRIELNVAPCELIPYADGTFDAATIAFGIRNVDDRLVGLREICRVLRPGGRLVVLEFSTPTSTLFRSCYYWYFRRVLPIIGGFFSSFKAYQYLPDSVIEFPSRQDFVAMMKEAGFSSITATDLTGGIVTIYQGDNNRYREDLLQ
jgi:demethylmenaquinone methyltransferase / 2-methoxy-6-polyprenyl-1,4-benzoquinol methylase